MLESKSLGGHPYDVLLLDWKMPGMGGLDTVRAMRASQHLAKLPATLMVTAYVVDEAAQEACRDDVAAFLTKPVDAQELLDALNRLFLTGDHLPEPETAASEPMPSATVAPLCDLPRLAEDLHGLRVLLVEDNEINREIAVELLTDAGLTVDCAEDGRVACQKVAEAGAGYAAILMDVQMPRMDGIAATREIRRHHPDSRLPIIAMTAHAYAEERQRCIAAGMNDHVAKPVDPQLLVRTLEYWIRAHLKTDSASAPPSAADTVPAARLPRAAGAPIRLDALPPDLPPFDLPTALARVNGNAALLRRLIISFAQTYGNVCGDLSDLLKKDRRRDATHLLSLIHI